MARRRPKVKHDPNRPAVVVAGARAGASLGANLGSRMFGPAGAVLGALAGALAGADLGGALSDALAPPAPRRLGRPGVASKAPGRPGPPSGQRSPPRPAGDPAGPALPPPDVAGGPDRPGSLRNASSKTLRSCPACSGVGHKVLSFTHLGPTRSPCERCQGEGTIDAGRPACERCTGRGRISRITAAGDVEDRPCVECGGSGVSARIEPLSSRNQVDPSPPKSPRPAEGRPLPRVPAGVGPTLCGVCGRDVEACQC